MNHFYRVEFFKCGDVVRSFRYFSNKVEALHLFERIKEGAGDFDNSRYYGIGKIALRYYIGPVFVKYIASSNNLDPKK